LIIVSLPLVVDEAQRTAGLISQSVLAKTINPTAAGEQRQLDASNSFARFNHGMDRAHNVIRGPSFLSYG
jgi:hypothetical protein